MGITINDLLLDRERKCAETLRGQEQYEQEKRQQNASDLAQKLDAWGLFDLLNLDPVKLDDAGSGTAFGAVDITGASAVHVSVWQHSPQTGVELQFSAGQAVTSHQRLPSGISADDARNRIAECAVLILANFKEWQSAQKAQAAFAQDIARQQEAALARGRYGAVILQQLAREYAEVSAAQAESARVWTEEWSTRLWQPWSGWLVRYAPVGPISVDEQAADVGGLIQRVLILDDLTAVVAESPGATVRAVSFVGNIFDFVIGAFLDAEPVEFTTPTMSEDMVYHAHVCAHTDSGCFYLNIPPMVSERPSPPPHCLTWPDWVAQRTGDNWSAWRWDPSTIAKTTVDEMASDPSVQAMADVELR